MAKGKRTISVGDKKLELRFSFGAVEDFCEQLDITFSDWQDEVFQSPKNMRILLFHLAKENAEGLKADDLRDLDFFEAIQTVTELIEESSQGVKKKAGKRGKK